MRDKLKNDNLAVPEEENIDEATPIYLKKEQKTQEYNEN